MHEIFPIIMIILMGAVIVWFILVKTLFIRLERHHPEKFKEMGEPSLVWNNSMKTNVAFLKFLVKREYIPLADPFLSRLSYVLSVFLLVYTVVIVAMIVSSFLM